MPFEPSQTGAPPETDASHQSQSLAPSDISMYTLTNATGSGDEELLGQLPQIDYYNDDMLHYYSMDIGTWIGLDNIR